jgi:hypothetical protein
MALRLSVLVLGASCTLLGNGVSLAEPPVAKKEVIVVDAGGKQVGPVIGMNEYFCSLARRRDHFPGCRGIQR